MDNTFGIEGISHGFTLLFLTLNGNKMFRLEVLFTYVSWLMSRLRKKFLEGINLQPLLDCTGVLWDGYMRIKRVGLDQVVNTLASGDRGQWFDPHPLQGRRSFSTFGRTESSLSTFGRGRAVYVSTSLIQCGKR
ncbi:hypothetical protein Tco_0819848, partial [Tanacetum coccineum]